MTHLQKNKVGYLLINSSKNLKPIFGNPQRDVEILLTEVLKIDRSNLIANLNSSLKLKQLKKFNQYLSLRKKSLPVEYIIKKAVFDNLELKVTQNTLIPRFDSLILVNEVLKFIKNNSIKQVVEVGVGSGALSIWLKLNSNNKINFLATDVCKKALKVAEFNAKKYKTNIKFKYNNLLNNFNEVKLPKNWVLFSNPPYVAKKDLKEPSIKFEPKKALDGGKEGLDFYKKILLQVSNLKNKPKAIFFEIGYNQDKDIINIAKNLFKKANISCQLDENKLPRVISIIL